MAQEIKVEIPEVTPVVHVPIKTFAEPKALTPEERQEIYEELRKYHDIHLLPLPEDFFDDDVTSERGVIQLEHDVHMYGLLKNKLIEMSEKEAEVLTKRVHHKIKLLKEMHGTIEELPPSEDCVTMPSLLDG